MRALLAATVLLLGCDTMVARPPIIDDVRMPQTATVSTAGGRYEVEGLLSFHDDDSQVAKLRIFIPLVGQAYEYPTNPPISNGTLTLQVQFAGSLKGPVEYHVSLIDSAGLESTPAKLSVTLQ